MTPALTIRARRAASDGHRSHQLVAAAPSARRTVGLASTASIARVVDLEEAQHPAHRGLVVGAKVVIYQHQHLLRREGRVIAAQLLHVAHDVRVEQRRGAPS